jgi:hypothetical protein
MSKWNLRDEPAVSQRTILPAQSGSVTSQSGVSLPGTNAGRWARSASPRRAEGECHRGKAALSCRPDRWKCRHRPAGAAAGNGHRLGEACRGRPLHQQVRQGEQHRAEGEQSTHVSNTRVAGVTTGPMAGREVPRAHRAYRSGGLGGPRWAVRVALARAHRCPGDRLVLAFHLGPSARFDQAEDWAVLRSPSAAVAGSRAGCEDRWEEVTRARHQWG